MIIETIIAYLAIIAPAAITVITSLFAIITAIVKFVNVVKENKGLKDEILALVKNEDDKIAAVLADNAELKKALTLCTEEITRIHQLHPEWLEKEE